MNTAQRTKKRPGCLASLALFAVFGVLAIMLLDGLFAPWIYVVGGKRRPFPVWQGTADFVAPSGRYRLYLSFSPVPNGSKKLPSVSVEGNGYICTPRGERFSLRVVGGAAGNIWKDMDGHDFQLGAYYRPAAWSFSLSRNWHPRLLFSGRWVGPNLEMNDGGSIAREFLPDGSLNMKANASEPKSSIPLKITISEVEGLVAAFARCVIPDH